MLLELAIADAYCAGMIDRSLELVLTHNQPNIDEKDSREEGSSICYTGITQSNAAIAKMLILGHPWVKEFLANSFITTFKQDPRMGYGDSFYRALQQAKDGSELIEMINPYLQGDNPSVRAIPVGILSTPEQVIKASITHAAITNNTPNSFNATIAVGLMSHYFIYRLGEKAQFKNFLDIYIDTTWLQSPKTNDNNLTIVKLAIALVLRHHSLSQLLEDCLTLEEHKNSITAIAIAIASCSEEYQLDLAQDLLESLENNIYGRDYLIDLDRKWQALKSN